MAHVSGAAEAAASRTSGAGRRLAALLAGAAAVLPVLVAPPAAGQSAGGGPLLTVGVSTGVTAHDNVRLDEDGGDGVSVLGDLGLDFGYSLATPIDQFTLSGNVGLSGASGDVDDRLDGVDGPRLRFGYVRSVPDALLSVSGSLSRSRIALDGTRGLAPIVIDPADPLDPVTPVDPLDPVDPTDPLDPLDPDGNPLDRFDLVDDDDEGIRLSYGLNTRLELRRRAPLTLSLQAGVGGNRFSDGATDGDERRYNLGAGLGFRINPITRASLDFGYSVFDEDADADGADLADRRETSSVAASITRQLQVGQIGATARTTRTEDGERYGLTFNASRQTALWSLSGRIGLSRETGGGIATVGSLSATRLLPLGQVTVAATRSVISGEDDEERVLTSASLRYGRDLTELTSVSADATYRRSEATEGEGSESAGSFGVSLNRQLAEDLSLSVAARHRFEDDGGAGGSAHDNILSLNLRRGFSFRP